MNDEGMIARVLDSHLVSLFKPENKSQPKIIKDHNSIRKNDFLINGGIPVTLYSNILTLRDINKSFKLDGDLLQTMTNYDFNVIHSNLQDQKLIIEFGEEMNFIKQKGRKSPRDQSLIKLLKSPANMASEISTMFLLENPNELCER